MAVEPPLTLADPVLLGGGTVYLVARRRR
jgi:hypothetical protein